MSALPQAKPYLAAIAPYSSGKSAAGSKPTIKLSSNENPYGCSPKAQEAIHHTLQQLHRYPEDNCQSLREAIATTYQLPADQLICGAGSDEVIRMLIHTYAGVGDEVLFPEHAFLMYRIYSQQFGATPVTAPETNLRTDVEALLAAVSERTRLVFVANPNNPTGSYITTQELAHLRAGLREDIILVVDGAYAEYMDRPDYGSGLPLVATSHTVITRTFSKAYGLPALRVGWGYAPASIIAAMHKVRGPFNVSQPAIAAAIAALHDQDFVADSVVKNIAERQRLATAFTALGLGCPESHGNFMLVDFTSAPLTAAQANTLLLEQGIVVRDVANYGLPHCLRITIGTAAENDAVIKAFSAFMG